MIRRLIILLLIVGCAPTTSNFYIGMTEEEFVDKNSNNSSIQKEYFISTPPDPNFDNRITMYYENERSIGAWFDILGLFTDYTFWFFDDSVYQVQHGVYKAVEIDSSRIESFKSLRKSKGGISWRWRK